MPTPKELANAIRFLSMDAIEKAKSGHPGAPLGMADMAEVLWNEFLKHNPENPEWYDRDRFVLSNGHASMLLYSVLHLSGYDLSIDDIKAFRQIHSKTPGHPERGITPGVEITSGPLGQGIASAVGMALAEKLLADEFNRDEFPIVDHFTYVFVGDGCLMEGVSHEACSFAGTLGLGKLIVLWDDNGISIDGKTQGWFSEDVAERFKAYGWQVIEDVDGHDAASVKKAIAKARRSLDKPSFICCKTEIGHGAPNKAGSEKCHGAPLGEEEIASARKVLNWNYPPFEIPAEVKKEWDARKKGKNAEKRWESLFEDYQKAFPELAEEFLRRMKGEMPEKVAAAFEEYLQAAQKSDGAEASRISSQKVLGAIAPHLPELFGGSADLTGSVGTLWKDGPVVKPGEPGGRHISYGVREFCMGAMMNGMSVHGGFIPYGGTFLVFADYAKNAIRLAALMKQRVVWVLTHDTVLLGEDGPTHQPVEQISMLRLTPDVHVWRPCDVVETTVAWQEAVTREDGPTCLALSRQNMPVLPRDAKTLAAIKRGGYIIRDSKGAPDVILIATGSEVALALLAAEGIEKKGHAVRVVSMPCAEVFEAQDREWKEHVLPHNIRTRVAIEAASADWWRKYVGLDGAVVGMTTFGESGPGKPVYEFFGFTVENIMAQVKNTLMLCGEE